jgi:hypothetical protein
MTRVVFTCSLSADAPCLLARKGCNNVCMGRLCAQGSTRSASPPVTVGAPIEEEEVEVRFGIPVDRDAVTVQLLASPSRSATPKPPAPREDVPPQPQPAGDRDGGRAAALAGAARFVFDKIAELRADLAKARLEMLKSELPLLKLVPPSLATPSHLPLINKELSCRI